MGAGPPVEQVTLIERGDVGRDASRGAAGMPGPASQAPCRERHGIQSGREGRRLYPEFVAGPESFISLPVDCRAGGACPSPLGLSILGGSAEFSCARPRDGL